MARIHEGGYRSTRITTATTTAVKTGTGTLVRLLFETASVGVVTVNDAVGVKTILPAAVPLGAVLELNIACAGKIEIVTAAADRLVAVYD